MSFQQKHVELSSLATLSKELIDQRILKNNNNTVSALACCCIADILRLYAPDPPYNYEELSVTYKKRLRMVKQLTDLDIDFFGAGHLLYLHC